MAHGRLKSFWQDVLFLRYMYVASASLSIDDKQVDQIIAFLYESFGTRTEPKQSAALVIGKGAWSRHNAERNTLNDGL